MERHHTKLGVRKKKRRKRRKKRSGNPNGGPGAKKKPITPTIAFERYQEDFKGLLDMYWKVYRHEPLPPNLPVHLKFAFKFAAKRYHAEERWITKEDLQQQLALTWTELVHNWEKSYKRLGKSYSLRRYLIKVGTFMILEYMNNLAKVSMISPWHLDEELVEEERTPDFQLDLPFLLYGSGQTPFASLTSWERRLLYLRYAMGYDTSQIARLSFYGQQYISNQLKAVEQKLRS